MFLNKARYSVRGYRRARPIAVHDYDRTIHYDIDVVDGWLAALSSLTEGEFSLTDKRVLELGPGPDLGTGMILLSRGASAYTAIDANNLAASCPPELYDRLAEKLGQSCDTSRLYYEYDPLFELTTIPDQSVDLVVSQAAFEHFDDPLRVIHMLRRVCQPSASIVIQVDLQTHTRGLRQWDPLNIYRYSDSSYNRLHFRGAPNRVRPYAYSKALVSAGWKEPVITPTAILSHEYVESTIRNLAERFQDAQNSMHVLSMVVTTAGKT